MYSPLRRRNNIVPVRKVLTFFTLFSSASTLLCCALPALLVAIGAGSVMATLVTHVPGLIWVSEHKTMVFIFAGIMLLGGGYLQWRARYEPCPLDEAKAQACQSSRRWSLVIYFISLVLYCAGGFFAYLAPILL